MPVKRLPFILLASTLFSGCSTSQIAENWHTPSAWFGTEEENQQKDPPLDSQQVVVAKGDEDLKADVAAGNGEDSASGGAPLDDAISRSFRPRPSKLGKNWTIPPGNLTHPPEQTICGHDFATVSPWTTPSTMPGYRLN